MTQPTDRPWYHLRQLEAVGTPNGNVLRWPAIPRLLFFLVILLIALPAQAQLEVPGSEGIIVGASVGPGIGGQVGVVLPTAALFTREGVVYVDYYNPGEETERLLVGLGIGGSMRVFRLIMIITDQPSSRFDVDVGIRFGPSFAFAFTEQSAATRARQFRLFADPFIRGSFDMVRGQVLYAELGTQPGHFRVGVMVGL